MTRAPSEFTEFEQAVLDAICSEQPDEAKNLRHLLSGAHIWKRDNIGHGFYTSFTANRNVPPVDRFRHYPPGATADIAAGDETLPMGFALWFDDGYPNCLEGFQFDRPSADNFDLKCVDLASLRWLAAKP